MQENLDSKKDLFEDRLDATKRLFEILPVKAMQDEDWLVVAISAEGVEMAEYICKRLNLFYDVLFTEPILAPNNSQCAIAMVSETEEIVIHDELINSFDVNIEYVYGEAHRRYEENILKYVYKYRKGELINSLKNKHILLVDEGCESGLTVLTSIKTAINAHANSVVFAVPMIPLSLENELEGVTDELYTLAHIEKFVDTDFYYGQKEPVSSEKVLEILENSKHYLPLQKIQTQKTKTGEKDE